jgi:hypothetical protein
LEDLLLDYELFYDEAEVLLKDIKDKTALQTKTVANVSRCLTNGDLNALPKLYATLREAAAGREEALSELEEHTSGFDGGEYMTGGEFSTQMTEYCRRLDVDVQGTFPVFDMFPCRITVNSDSQDVTIDRKKFACLRPSRIAEVIKAELGKLAKAPFNPQAFAKELAAAYDIAILRASKKKKVADDAPIFASDIYDILTPMRRYKKEYTKNNFAFDLARLYAQDAVQLADGRNLRFDTVRDMKKSIRILDSYGLEQFVTTIRFVES